MKILINGIIKLFLQYVFRPLDHALFSKDRCSSRFAVLDPVAGYVKDFRTALTVHGFYPLPTCPAWSVTGYCSKCPGAACFWCVECHCRFCPGCAARYHHPGLYSEHHSLEPIKKQKEQRLAALLLSNFLVVGTILYLLSSVKIGRGYLFSMDMCPVISKAKTLATRVDAKVFYYYKADLARYCNMEDSFYKFFLDGWVRGVVTGSDDTLLVLTSAGPAYVMVTVLSLFLVPVVATLYGWFMGIAHFIDSKIPSEDIHTAEAYLRSFDVCAFFGGQSLAPPMTEPRLRADQDFYDAMKYNANRRMRFSNYYATVAKDDLTYWVHRSVPWFCGFRLLLIWCPFDLAYLLRIVFSFFGMGKAIRQHELWFRHAVSNMIFSDAFSLSFLQNFNSLTLEILALLPFGVGDGVKSLILSILLGILAVIGVFIALVHRIVTENREYTAKWGDGEGAETVGSCALDTCPCASIQFFERK